MAQADKGTSGAAGQGDRAEICRRAASALRERAGELSRIPVLVGFDGFVDSICHVVETRTDARRYEAVPTITRLAEKFADAAGRSGNYEIVVRREKLGGNGPIMADALARAGLEVTYIGTLGEPELHPVFAGFASRADLRSVAPPARTDALEFDDGKLMLGKLEPLGEVTWERLRHRLGAETFERLIARSRLLAMVNWTMIPEMSRIWAKLCGEVFPEMPEQPSQRRMIFVDLADPEKRTSDDIAYALKLLGKMQQWCDVTLGMNLKESGRVARVLGLEAPEDPVGAIAETAGRIREAVGVECCVVHPRNGAAAATADGQARFEGPFTQNPKISTGAGDHFNAGFMLGRLLGLDIEGALCTGSATSGHYVRTASSPSALELAEFIDNLPRPEPADAD